MCVAAVVWASCGEGLSWRAFSRAWAQSSARRESDLDKVILLCYRGKKL